MPATFNRFVVSYGAQGGLVLMNPPIRGQRLTADEAVTLAAYLVALAEDGEMKFALALQAVKET